MRENRGEEQEGKGWKPMHLAFGEGQCSRVELVVFVGSFFFGSNQREWLCWEYLACVDGYKAGFVSSFRNFEI
jgi:hypothetical protein